MIIKMSRTSYLGHVVVVQGQIWELLVPRELHFVVVMTVLRHGCNSYSTWKEMGGGGVIV